MSTRTEDADAAEAALEARLESLRQNPEQSSTPVAAETEKEAEADASHEGVADVKEESNRAEKPDSKSTETSKPDSEKAGDQQKEEDKGKDSAKPSPPPGMTWKTFRETSRRADRLERENRKLLDQLQGARRQEELVSIEAKANGYTLDVEEDREPNDADLAEAVKEFGPEMGKKLFLSNLESHRLREQLKKVTGDGDGSADTELMEAVEANPTVYDWMLMARSGDDTYWKHVKAVEAELTGKFANEVERISHIQEEVEKIVKEEAKRIAAEAKTGTADPATPARSLSNAPGTTGEGDDVERFLAMTREQRMKHTDKLQDEGRLDELDGLLKGISDRDAA